MTDDASAAGRRWVVDSLGDAMATVEVDGETTQKVPRWLLPSDAREGDVLAVTLAQDGARVTVTVERDAGETRAAREASERQMAEAPVDEQGGDVTL